LWVASALGNLLAVGNRRAGPILEDQTIPTNRATLAWRVRSRTRASRNPQPTGVRFHATLGEEPKMELTLI
jgi:hypothetical protein